MGQFIDLGHIRQIRRTRRAVGRINGMLSGVNLPAVQNLSSIEATLKSRERSELINTLNGYAAEDIIDNISRIAYLARPE